MSLFDNKFSYCVNCGSKIEKDEDFCCNCGTGTSDSRIKKQKQEARAKLYEITGGFLISSEFLLKTKDLNEEHRELIIKSIEEEIENSYLKYYEIEPKVDELITFYRVQKLEEHKRKIENGTKIRQKRLEQERKKQEEERKRQKRIDRKIKKAKERQKRKEEEEGKQRIVDEKRGKELRRKYEEKNINPNITFIKDKKLYKCCNSDEFKNLPIDTQNRIINKILNNKIKKEITLKRIIRVNSISKTEYTTDKYNFKLNKQIEEERIKENRKRAISKLHPFVYGLYQILEYNQFNEEIKDGVECINKNLLSKYDSSEYIIDLHSKYFLKRTVTGRVDWNQKMYGSEVDFFIKDYNEIAINPNRSISELIRSTLDFDRYYLNKITGYLDKRPVKFIEFIMNGKNPGVYQLIAEYGYFSYDDMNYWSFVKIILNEYCGLYGEELYNEMVKLDNALKAHKLKSVFNEFEKYNNLKNVPKNTSKLLLMRNAHISYFDRRKCTTIELKTDEDDREYRFSRKNYFVIKERNKIKTSKELEDWVRYKSTTSVKVKEIVRRHISVANFKTINEVIDFINFCEINLDKSEDLYELYKKSNKK